MASPNRPPLDPRPTERLSVRKPFFSDLYHFFLTTTWPRMFAIVLVVYLATNGIFAVYLLGGDCIDHARKGSFGTHISSACRPWPPSATARCFRRLSMRTSSSPSRHLPGLLGLAMATGLVFSKFARPSARVMFSNPPSWLPRRCSFVDVHMANERATQIVEAQLRVVLLRDEVTKEGESVRRFH